MESSIQIEERAGQWLARRDSGVWGEDDEAAFDAWLEQSTLHVVAFVRLEAAWKQAKRLKALSAGTGPGAIPSPQEWQLDSFFDPAAVANPVAPARRITIKRWAIAASILIAITAGVAWYLRPFDSTYRTPVGGIASVPMSDGSKVTLNTDSRIRLAVTQTERRVELQQGEAFFDVAKDPKRPFVVAAGNKRIVAVGTQFSVRRDGQNVRVFITEGKVRIEDEAQGMAAKSADEQLLTLSAGSIARTSPTGVLVQEQTVPEVESYLSWRTGYLLFRDAKLADAAAEFNRYNTRKIVIEDAAVGAIRVSGKFRSTQFEAFVRLVEDGFPIQARYVDDRIVLSDRRQH